MRPLGPSYDRQDNALSCPARARQLAATHTVSPSAWGATAAAAAASTSCCSSSSCCCWASSTLCDVSNHISFHQTTSPPWESATRSRGRSKPTRLPRRPRPRQALRAHRHSVHLFSKGPSGSSQVSGPTGPQQQLTCAGADSGIGAAAVHIFAAAGAQVIYAIDIKDRNLFNYDAEVKAKGLKTDVLGVTVDISDDKEVEALVRRVVKEQGKLDWFVSGKRVVGFGEASDLPLRKLSRRMDHTDHRGMDTTVCKRRRHRLGSAADNGPGGAGGCRLLRATH